MVRVVVAAIAAAVACGPARVPRQPLPTLEPARDDRTPIDPYGNDGAEGTAPVLHGFVGDHVPTDVMFGDPAAIVAMTVRVFAHGGMRELAIRVGPGAPVTAAERADALLASEAYDFHTPAVARAARAATLGTRTARQRVAALVAYVHGRITYALADEHVASHVLASGSGDCSEMSLLFIALARAAGIPARRAIGLAATYEDGGPAFGLHAWAEVALAGRWVPVDPTWNEPLADATHILLFEGEGNDWATGLDDFQLAVLDYTRDERLAGRADVRRLVSELPVRLRTLR
ncbi:MAG TPA: transglutaminase domain-containing protein [Kofleriaceae bacterium]|nr:transglutaminase domain-containing protein [Kofleriaceae bacterium]